jgi:hypothetical protein
MADLQTFLAENRKNQPVSPPVDIRAAISKTNEKQDNMGTVPYIHNASGGVLRGMLQMAETPYNLINNAPKLVNLLPGEQGAKKLSETGTPGFSAVGEDPLIKLTSKAPGMQGLETPNPNYPITTNIAEGFGQGITGLGMMSGLAKAPGIAGKFAQFLNTPVQAAPKAAVAAELASAAGGETGRVIAEKNNAGPIATFFAQLLGSMGPGAMAYSLPQSAKMLGREGGEETLDALTRQGIRPSIGLTGNRAAGQIESGASALPFFSAVPENVRTQQFDQFTDALTGAADNVRPAGTGPLTNNIDLSQQVYDIAEGGANKLKTGFSAREEALMNTIGNDTLIDTNSVRAALTGEMKYATGSVKQALQKELDALGELADEAGRVPAKALRNWRSNFGAGIEDQGLLKGAKSQVYKTATEDIQRAADGAGVGDDFRTLMSEQAAANADDVQLSQGGDLPMADKLGSGQLERSGQFLKQAYANPDKMDYIKRNATPEQWDNLRANIAQDLGLAKAGAQDATGDIISPNKFITEWNKMDPRVKNMLFDDDLGTRQTLDDLALISDAFKKRGLEANSSRTAGTGMGAMEIKQGAKTAAAVATGAAGMANLPLTIGGVTLTYGAVKGLMSETLARWAAGQTPTASGTVGARLPGAVSHASTDKEEAEKRPPVRQPKRVDDDGDHEYR